MFKDQIALVTGGSTGIGAATALHLARNGAKVLITGRTEAPLREAAARDGNIQYVVADITRDVARTIEAVKSRFGSLDILVNNAGVFELAPLSDASPEHVHRVMETNVVGLVELTRAALPLLRRSKGTIVNVASVVADTPFANMGIYSASKAAVLALTRAWAKELAGDGIRVNAVSPGPIETPIFGKLGMPTAQLDQMAAAIVSQVPSGRFGKPEEVAEVVGFLASQAASFVTGSQYTVGGGIEA